MKLFTRLISKAIFFAFLWFSALTAPASATERVTVAAASSLRFVLDEIISNYQNEHKVKITVVYGSSGNLFNQIKQGAPFDVFLAANEDYVERLRNEGIVSELGRVYALGKLALFVNHSVPVDVTPQNLEDLFTLSQQGKISKISMANPRHAPYGQRAQQALTKLGLYQGLMPFLVFGENVAQATQFVATGAAQAGLVSYGFAKHLLLSQKGRFVLIDDQLYEPLRHSMVGLRQTDETRKFIAYMEGSKARAVLELAGYGLP